MGSDDGLAYYNYQRKSVDALHLLASKEYTVSKLTSYELADRLVSLSLIAPSGFTVHSQTFVPPTDGFTVGGVYTSYAGRHLYQYDVPTTEAERIVVCTRLADVIHGCGGTEQLQQEAFFFGGWGVESSAGEHFVIDITTVYESRVAAKAVALERNQHAFGEVRGFKYQGDTDTVEVN
jgi:hypothetical protein